MPKKAAIKKRGRPSRAATQAGTVQAPADRLRGKKDLVLNAVRLGMSWRDAALACAIPDDEVRALEADSAFAREIQITERVLERDLLQLHDQAIAVAVEKGNGAPLQWRLACINPTRWSGKNADGTPAGLDLNLTIRKVRIDGGN